MKRLAVLAVGVFLVACSESTGPTAVEKSDQLELRGMQWAPAQSAQEKSPVAASPVALVSVGATTMEFNTSDSQFDALVDNHGWWSDADGNFDENDNYVVGRLLTSTFRNFFTFDLSPMAGATSVIAATLEVRRGFSSSANEASETYSLFDVSTDAATLNNNVGTNAAIFSDLGSGTSYGVFDVAGSGASGDLLSFNLNPAALVDILAAAGGFFSIGGALTSQDGDDFLMGGTSGFGVQRLVVEFEANSPPVAEDDYADTDENTPTVVDVLANDIDPDGDALIVTTVVTPPNHGTAIINGHITYTPSAGYYGPDEFTYLVADVNGATDQATVYVTVHPDVSIAVRPEPGEMGGGTINSKSGGVIPVAILSGQTSFESSEIDLSTLAFGPGGATPVHDPTAWDAEALADHLMDVDLDGVVDLVTHYRQNDIGLASGDTEACLSGTLLDGTGFLACDAVIVR